MPGIFGHAPSRPTRSVSGVSSAKIAAAARLYPNIFCCDDWAKAKSRRYPPTTALTSASIRGPCTAIPPVSAVVMRAAAGVHGCTRQE